jgi:hypothetical protein
MTAEPQSLIELWTRRGISAAGVATSFGFYTAKKSTQIGVSNSHLIFAMVTTYLLVNP